MRSEPGERGDEEGDGFPSVPELSELISVEGPDFVEPVLKVVRRRESMGYVVGFACGGVFELLHAVAEWLTSLVHDHQDGEGVDS